jgi:hypothetical protein
MWRKWFSTLLAVARLGDVHAELARADKSDESRCGRRNVDQVYSAVVTPAVGVK